MAYVYLIAERDNDTVFKIGTTKKKDIHKRLKELQTGNSSELYIYDFFETKYPYKLEASLHQTFSSKQLINEWYELSKDDLDNFIETCTKKEAMFDALQDNPFFNKTIPIQLKSQY